jgi:hypothetical protein
MTAYVSVSIHIIRFVGTTAELQKASITIVCLYLCPPVRPSVRMEQLGAQLTDFHEIRYLNIFQKSIQKIQILIPSDKNNGILS